MPDIDDLFTDPNASAYVVDEPRSGPPLSYVGEKLRGALQYAHRLALSAHAQHDVKRDADATFRYALTAYLALYNMLGLMSDHRKVDALLELNDDEFEDWLTTVQREGSVSG